MADDNIIEIKPGISLPFPECEAYIDELATALRTAHLPLLQSRKIGVELVVPEAVRHALVGKYGDEARDWLAKIDGRVFL